MPFIIGSVILIILLIIVWYISTVNTFRTLEVKIDEAESGIDVALAKRHDVLVKMLDVCKAHMKYESETIEKVIGLRKGMTVSEKARASAGMDELGSKISVTAEAYPELKASENFKMLQKSILDTEEHLQGARRAYNSNVSAFNSRRVSFPVSLIANSRGFTEKSFFEASETQKSNVEIRF